VDTDRAIGLTNVQRDEDAVTTNGTAQTRTANRRDEITAVAGLSTPTYDLNGNLTTDEAGRQFKYDA
jgi:hypothetical protein